VFGGSDSTVVGEQQGIVGASKGYQYGYSVTQNGYPQDNSGKDDNFRGEAIFNKTLYVSKGSGGNGINTVYQVGVAGALPTFATAANTQISVLPGFSTTLAKSTTGSIHLKRYMLYNEAFTTGITPRVSSSHNGSQNQFFSKSAGITRSA
jgi:hypothetical protein